METNYLKIAFRNFRRHKAFASINIVGLAVGLTGFAYRTPLRLII